MTFTWMENSETGAKWESPDDYVFIAEKRGWVKCDPPAEEYVEPPAVAAEPLPEPEQTGFDPNEHSAAEVVTYLAEVPADAPGERERVLEAERAGKNRKSITGDN